MQAAAKASLQGAHLMTRNAYKLSLFEAVARRTGRACYAVGDEP